MSGLREPIDIPAGQLLRVLIYARYSTDEQDPSSITDQIDYGKEFLVSADVTDENAQFDVIDDEGISGEQVSRPGINQVWEGIRARRWDLIVCEDSSRLYRHETVCGQLIETAVDLGIRVICINDDVDTAEEDVWQDRLSEAMHHHAKSNRFTALRIKRKHDGLWRMGAALGLIKTGYRRKPSIPATESEPAKGPFFDEIDPQWREVIHEAFERIARGEPPWLVGEWLTKQGLPKRSNSLNQEWTDKNVRALIKNPIYRGVEEYRNTVSKKKFISGKHEQKPNDPKKVLTREMPHLRMVADWLWYEAVDAIENRGPGHDVPKGIDHPLGGIPRTSRGPLSELFFCVCSRKMHMDGRGQGGYRCGGSKSERCWNKASAIRDLVHERIGKAIVDQLMTLDGALDEAIDHVVKIFRDDGHLKDRKAQLLAEERGTLVARERLADAIEKAKEPPEVILQRLETRDEQLVRIRAELQRLESEEMLPSQIPTREQICERIEEILNQILTMDREAGVILRNLVSEIRAVPYQQFDSNKVALRAKFTLKFVGLLPERLADLLNGVYGGDTSNDFLQTIEMSVDLFEPSAAPKYGLEALALKESGLTLAQIGKRLGITKRCANIAAQYGKKMAEAGITDPFIELTEPPEAASRWRNRRRLHDDQSREAG